MAGTATSAVSTMIAMPRRRSDGITRRTDRGKLRARAREPQASNFAAGRFRTLPETRRDAVQGALISGQSRHPVLALQLADLQAQGGDRHVQALGGLYEGARPRHRLERARLREAEFTRARAYREG